ncbi:unknown protein [Seminavis robusta]|uniref:Uncharacterized protein n=1 Tax=Seminavis robusta TaxID=568900 RepID=A0A9N8HUW8_9STRA|nr:unknown protein [Seminavis robusta]|eukprot:Sro1891_g303760.1 n/a (661) ;mRNA; f:4131-6113
MAEPGAVGPAASGPGVHWAPLDKLTRTPPSSEAAFLDSNPNAPSTKDHERKISTGAKEAILTSKLNRLGQILSWGHMIDEYPTNGQLHDYEWDLILGSQLNPKLELWAAHQLDLLDVGHSCITMEGNFIEKVSCLRDEFQKYLDQEAIDMEAPNGATMMASAFEFAEMKSFARIWRKHLSDTYSEHLDEVYWNRTAEGLINEEFAESAMRTRRSVMYPAPYIFDRNIALWDKNSFTLPIQATPFPLGADRAYSSLSDGASTQCSLDAHSDYKATTATVEAATSFKSALNRRFKERKGEPLTNIADWKYHNAGSADIFPEETVKLGSVAFDAEGNLLPGNLTKRTLGRTAKWLMVTPWLHDENLQNLVERSQQDEILYSKAATEVYDSDHPCDKTATNTDLFVFAISIAMAGFGALTGFLKSVHSCFHWWALFCIGKPPVQAANAKPQKGCLLYEMFFVFLGMLIFIGLFVPLVVQTVEEVKAANYKREFVTMKMHYGEWDYTAAMTNSISSPTLVTFVQAESYCEEARPTVMLTMLIVGLVITILANAPLIDRALRVLKRFVSGQTKAASNNSSGYTIYDEELVALNPVDISDFKRQSVRDWVANTHLGHFFRCCCCSPQVNNTINTASPSAAQIKLLHATPQVQYQLGLRHQRLRQQVV